MYNMIPGSRREKVYNAYGSWQWHLQVLEMPPHEVMKQYKKLVRMGLIVEGDES